MRYDGWCYDGAGLPLDQMRVERATGPHLCMDIVSYCTALWAMSCLCVGTHVLTLRRDGSYWALLVSWEMHLRITACMYS